MNARTILEPDELQLLLDALARRGYRVLGPTVREQVIVYDDIASVADLPRGWSDAQDGGQYRLVRRDDAALFGYAVGPQSWKRFLHPPRQELWRAERHGEEVRVIPAPVEAQALALIGVRACELQAMAIQDRVLRDGAYADVHYKARRAGAFIVAVNCGTPGGTCFCASMGSGPRAEAGFDLSLTEIVDARRHVFLAEAGSEAGHDVLAGLPRRAPTAAELADADAVSARAAASMGRSMRAEALPGLLTRNLEHPRWDDVAQRCLGCGNCTMVCPTCFCSTTEDASELDGASTSRSRRWDSCFALDFTHLHGGNVRASTRSRYRQWMTHKLASWFDQFDTSGCVGCGRCITWCPVGIDITEEVSAIYQSERIEEAADGRA